MIKQLYKAAIVILALLIAAQVHAQGQDSTPAERDIMILAELLPGLYDNANQSYFDVRLKQPEAQRHQNIYREVTRVDDQPYLFVIETGTRSSEQDPVFLLYKLEVDNDVGAVRMKTYRLPAKPRKGRRVSAKAANYVAGCDILWRQQAGQF